MGDRIIGMTTLSTTPLHSTVLEEAIAAPTRPPISACDDDEGSPKYQVSRFHAMAPTSAAKTMGVVVLALNVGGYHDGDSIPIWVYFSSAAVLAAGTYSGGWRIMRTLGRRIIELDPPHGFAAESTA